MLKDNILKTITMVSNLVDKKVVTNQLGISKLS